MLLTGLLVSSEIRQDDFDRVYTLADAIPGEPDTDYPILGEIPETDFSCVGRTPGRFPDLELLAYYVTLLSRYSRKRVGKSNKIFFLSGYYADIGARCQVFRVCANTANNTAKGFAFLCPNGTLFNQGKLHSSD